MTVKEILETLNKMLFDLRDDVECGRDPQPDAYNEWVKVQDMIKELPEEDHGV